MERTRKEYSPTHIHEHGRDRSYNSLSKILNGYGLKVIGGIKHAAAADGRSFEWQLGGITQ